MLTNFMILTELFPFALFANLEIKVRRLKKTKKYYSTQDLIVISAPRCFGKPCIPPHNDGKAILFKFNSTVFFKLK